jgi:hypothetical protein
MFLMFKFLIDRPSSKTESFTIMSIQLAAHSLLLLPMNPGPMNPGPNQKALEKLLILVQRHQRRTNPLFRDQAMKLWESLRGVARSDIERLKKAIDFLTLKLQPSPWNTWLCLCSELVRHRLPMMWTQVSSQHPLMMRTQVSCHHPLMISGLAKLFFKGLQLNSKKVNSMKSLILGRVTSGQIHRSVNKASKKCLNAVACGNESSESLWEFVKMGHVPTIRDLIWSLIMGRQGIPENLTAAIYLATIFPHAATPGACLKMAEWNTIITSSWTSVQDACEQGCAQSLYVAYQKEFPRDDSDDEDTENAQLVWEQQMDFAMECLRKAAERGLPDAQYSLAEKLWWKDRNFDECHALLLKAAEQGHELAIITLNHPQVTVQILPFPQW